MEMNSPPSESSWVAFRRAFVALCREIPNHKRRATTTDPMTTPVIIPGEPATNGGRGGVHPGGGLEDGGGCGLAYPVYTRKSRLNDYLRGLRKRRASLFYGATSQKS